MSLDLRLIRQAQALAQHGSFTRAADALGVAQPTLSRSIKDLEGELGLPLFLRHRFGVEPTDFGRMFLQQAAMVVAQVNDLEREVANAKGLQKGELSVGFGPYAAEALAPGCMQHFASAHPSVRLRIEVDALEVLGRSLRTRVTDLVVRDAATIDDDESTEVIARLPRIMGHLLARSGHPLTTKASVSMSDALDYPFVQISRLSPRLLKPLLAARRVQMSQRLEATIPFPAIECPTVHLGISTIVGSDALMLATLGMARPQLESGQVVPILQESWMFSDWTVTRLRKRALAPAASAFIEVLQRVHQGVLKENELLSRRWTPKLKAVGPRRGSAAHAGRKVAT